MGCSRCRNLSLDGPEGPGSYGFNSNVELTILVGRSGKVIGYAVFSQYSSSYGDPGADQREAVNMWRRNAERRSGL